MRSSWLLVGLLAGCNALLGVHDFSADAGGDGGGPLGDWAAVATGSQHTCGIRTDQSLWCWGDNQRGQVGTGTRGDQVASPTRIGTGRWSAIAAGAEHTCGIEIDGTLWCWGVNQFGQAGQPTTAGVAFVTPQRVGADTWLQITAGLGHTCAIRSDGRAACWGHNEAGEVGDGTQQDRASPTLVTSETWIDLSAGLSHTCGIQSTHLALCWGVNAYGQVAAGTGALLATPLVVDASASYRQIAAGGGFTCGLREDGNLRCWGYGSSGSLGNGRFDLSDDVGPVGDDDGGWRAVTAGAGGTVCGIRNDGSLRCWGEGGFRQLGSVPPTTVASPIAIAGSPAEVALVAPAGRHTCAIDTRKQLWCIGSNGAGQLGIGTGPHPTPTQIPGAWSSVTAGGAHTCAIDLAGALACWGLNLEGQIGDGTQITRDVPTPVASIGSGTWTLVEAGGFHTTGAKGQQLLSWGSNGSGELANHTTTPSLTPTASGSGPWSQLSSAGHTCAIASDLLLCWGANNVGQLGTGDTMNRTQLTQVFASTSWKQVAATDDHTCAIDTTDHLHCWGANDYGELGDGTTNPSLTSVDVPGGWRSVTTGGFTTCGVDTANNGWCWGYGGFGSLGNGETTDRKVPTRIDASSWSMIAGGGFATCGLHDDHSLWCWGNNDYGQLGDGSFVSRTNPVRSGEMSWQMVAGGGATMCGITTDAALWCWGSNEYGQIGDSTAFADTFQLVP